MKTSAVFNSKGFTLLEIVIAIAILGGLSILTAQAVRNALNNRTKFSRQIKDDAIVRDVLRVMERDISLAFHYREFQTTMINDISHEQNTKPPSQPGQAPPAPVDPFASNPNAVNPNDKPLPKNLTAFIGDGESLNFTSLSNVRTYQDAPEGDQAEIGYYVRTCKGRTGSGAKAKATSSRCLVRRVSPYLDEDVTKGGNEVVLVENVQEFKLRYFGPERDDWVEVWKTGRDGDAISKENFPYAVEITLTVQDKADPKSKPVSMLVVAPIRFPNNPPKKENAPPGAGNAP